MAGTPRALRRARDVDTRMVPEREQLACWRDALERAFVALDVERADARDRHAPFVARMRLMSAGPIGIARIACDGQRVRRTPRQIERRADDVFYLNYVIDGSARAAQAGREARMGPGDFSMVDATRPFELEFAGAQRHLCFSIPGTLLRRRLGTPQALTGARVRAGHGTGALASRTLRALALSAEGLDREGARAAADHVTGLVALALRSAAPVAAPPPERARLLRAALDEVEARLDDPGLSPGAVAARVGLSTRQLHRLFADRELTFGRWVLDRRLAGAHRDLAEPGWDRWTIAAIAARWGFQDASYFARAFRTRYGVSPRQHRRAGVPAQVPEEDQGFRQ